MSFVQRNWFRAVPLVFHSMLSCWTVLATCHAVEHSGSLQLDRPAYRGPIDLVIATDEAWAVTVNETSDSLTLVDLVSQRVLQEVACEGRPAACVRLGEKELLVSCRDAGVVRRFEISRESGQITVSPTAVIDTGFEPLGLSVSPRNNVAYVGLVASGEVAEVDLLSNQTLRRFHVGQWPRYLAVSPDGSKLAVGLSGESSLAVFSLPDGKLEYDEPLSGGINFGHMRCSSNGKYVYFPWMIYRSNPIGVGNIRRGWVLASRLARVRLDGPAYREAISLDVPGLAVADPHGIAITPNEKRVAVTSSGTHELLCYRLPDLPFIAAGGPGDLIDQRLLRDNDAFYRIKLGGRPMGLEPSSNNRTVYVVNHALDQLQIVDLESRQLIASVSLGLPETSPDAQLVHRGMEIFHDAGRSLDQWYSCRSCHLDGGSNAKAMDTWNDGTELTAKTVLPLFDVTRTGPWTWHGWQTDLDESIQNSFVSTMQGEAASPDDVRAVRAYLASLRRPNNPFHTQEQDAAAVVAKGKQLFESTEVGCSSCHSGASFSDGEIHDVGLGGEADKYRGYNTPSLLGVYQKVRLLHDGRSKSLRDVLTNWHTPQAVGGGAELNHEELDQLIAYLKTL